eukprot:3365330-Pyramimonas_sp.AAC.1
MVRIKRAWTAEVGRQSPHKRELGGRFCASGTQRGSPTVLDKFLCASTRRRLAEFIWIDEGLQVASSDKEAMKNSGGEDSVLRQLVSKQGAKNWSMIARNIEGRSSKSCRLRTWGMRSIDVLVGVSRRWVNQLDPDVRQEAFTEE